MKRIETLSSTSSSLYSDLENDDSESLENKINELSQMVQNFRLDIELGEERFINLKVYKAIEVEIKNRNSHPLEPIGSNKRTALHDAVTLKDTKRLYVLGEKVSKESSGFSLIDQRTKDVYGQTPLHLAASLTSQKKIEIICFLTNIMNMSVIEPDLSGNTPLSILAMKGDFQLFVDALDQVPNSYKIDTQDEQGNTWLHHLCRHAEKIPLPLFKGAVKRYQDQGGDLSLRNNANRTVANMVEAHCGRWIPKLRSDVSLTQNEYEDVFSKIICKDELMGLMLDTLGGKFENQPKFNSKDIYKMVLSGDLDKVTSLLKAGVNPNKKNGFEKTPIDIVLSGFLDFNLKKEMVCLLVKNGAVISPEQLIQIKSHPDLFDAVTEAENSVEKIMFSNLIKYLKEKGTGLVQSALTDNPEEAYWNVGIVDHYLGPLHFAVQTKDLDLIKLAFAAGSDLNLKFGPLGQTPLHKAAILMDTHLIQTLIDFGGDICKLDRRGRTPLHELCSHRDLLKKASSCLLKQLYHKSMDLERCDSNGFSVLDYLKKSGRSALELQST